MTDSITTSPDADTRRRFDAARARWLANSDDTTKRMVEYYTALQKVDPAVIVERSRKIRAILDGEDDVKAVVKKVRKTRAAPFTQAQVRRAVKAAESVGKQRVTFNPDGSVTFERAEEVNPVIDNQAVATAASWG